MMADISLFLREFIPTANQPWFIADNAYTAVSTVLAVVLKAFVGFIRQCIHRKCCLFDLLPSLILCTRLLKVRPIRLCRSRCGSRCTWST